MTTHRVLVVEDDHGLRDVLARGLRDEGYTVLTAADGASALHAATAPTEAGATIDALVLDIGLPDADGRDVCAALRAQGLDTPVLFLTARGNLTDRLSGFASGGDDYLPKPFAFSELLARLRALLKRGVDPVGAWGDLVLDPTTYALTCGATRVPLSPTEFRLLAKLLAAPDTVVRRRELTSTAWPAGAVVSENTLDQYISRLRRKLLTVRSRHGIEAARGVGYRLV